MNKFLLLLVVCLSMFIPACDGDGNGSLTFLIMFGIIIVIVIINAVSSENKRKRRTKNRITNYGLSEINTKKYNEVDTTTTPKKTRENRTIEFQIDGLLDQTEEYQFIVGMLKEGYRVIFKPCRYKRSFFLVQILTMDGFLIGYVPDEYLYEIFHALAENKNLTGYITETNAGYVEPPEIYVEVTI